MTSPKTPHPVRLVIFDFDGTLYALPRFLKLRVTLMMFSSVGILRRMSRVRDWLRRQEYPTQRELFQAFFQELGRSAGKPAEVIEKWYFNDFNPAVVRMMRRNCKPRPGLDDLLDHLSAAGIKTAIVSDIGFIDERLQALQISPDRFSVRLSSEETGALKPHPRSFLAAARKVGSPPAETMVIGDRIDLDGAAAQAAGMQFLYVSPSDRSTPPGALSWPRLLSELRIITR